GRAECFVAGVQLDMGDVQGAGATYQKIKNKYFTDSIALSASDVIGQAELTEGKRLGVMRQTAQSAEHFAAAMKAMKDDANDPQAGDSTDQRRLVALYLDAVTNAGSAAADAGRFDEAQAAHKLAFDEARKKQSTETEAEAALQLAEDFL